MDTTSILRWLGLVSPDSPPDSLHTGKKSINIPVPAPHAPFPDIDPSRRKFLRNLLGTTGIAVVGTTIGMDLEKLLWVPGERVISVPAVATPAIRFITTQDLNYYMLEALKNNMILLRDPVYWDFKPGTTINVRRPSYYAST